MVAPNTSLSTSTYVAILKAKQGELLALQTTPPDRFIPLLEVIEAGKSTAIARCWPRGGDVIWVQPLNYAGTEDDLWADATDELFAELRGAGTAAVPVLTLDETAESLAVLNGVVANDSRGMVLRLECEEVLEEDPPSLKIAIDAVLAAIGVSPVDVDLVLDAGLVSGGVAVQSGAASAALATLPYVSDWRSTVVAFSGFPELVGDVVAKSSVGAIPRTDAAAFNHLTSRWTTTPLVFADYGVGVPTYAEGGWSPIPNIRYAVRGEWMIHRAATKLDPSPQYVQLAKDLSTAPYFSGAGFSAGDAYIAAVATGGDGPGNAGSYLKAAMSRHFCVVLDSLATLGAP